jgi:hypothetical protein
MRTLCEENGVELILMKAPTNTPQWYWYEQWDQQIEDFAKENQLLFLEMKNKHEDNKSEKQNA